MPKKEKTSQDKTKVEDTHSTLNCDVDNGQRDPIDVLEQKNLKTKELTNSSVTREKQYFRINIFQNKIYFRINFFDNNFPFREKKQNKTRYTVRGTISSKVPRTLQRSSHVLLRIKSDDALLVGL